MPFFSFMPLKNSHIDAIAGVMKATHFCSVKINNRCSSNKNFKAMKKILTMVTAIILATGVTAFAADNRSDNPVTQKTSYQLSFVKLQVQDDIDVLLVENPERAIEFKGSEANIAKVDWEIKDGVLYIKSKDKRSLKGKVQLTINVSHLQELAIKGDSEIKSAGELNSAFLSISLEGNCSVSVRNKGQISVLNNNEQELEIKKVVGDVIFG